jgi:hypothetical protein
MQQNKSVYSGRIKSLFSFNYRIFTSFSMPCFIFLRCLKVCSAYNNIATTHNAVSVITLAYASPAPSGVLGVGSDVSDVGPDVVDVGSDVSDVCDDVSGVSNFVSGFESRISVSILKTFVVYYSKTSHVYAIRQLMLFSGTMSVEYCYKEAVLLLDKFSAFVD